MSPAAQDQASGTSKAQRPVTELTTLEFQGLMTLAVRNGVLQAYGVIALIGFLVGLVVFALNFASS